MGTADRLWGRLSLVLVAGGLCGAVVALGCGEDLQLTTPADGGDDGASGGVVDGGTSDAASPTQCSFEREPTAPWIFGAGDPQAQRVHRMVADDRGNVIVGINYDGPLQLPVQGAPLFPSAGGGDVLIASLDSAGGWRWGVRLGETDGQYVTALSVHGSMLYAAIQFQGTIGGLQNGTSVAAYVDGYTDALVLRMNAYEGTTQGHVHLRGAGQQSIAAIAQPNEASAIIVGENAGWFEWPPDAPNPVVTKGDYDGIVGQVFTGDDWMRDWGGDNGAGGPDRNQRVTSVAVSKSANRIAVAGHFDSAIVLDDVRLETAGGDDIYVHVLDAAGKSIGAPWPKRFGDSARQSMALLAFTDDDDIVVAGSFFGEIDFGAGPLVSTNADIFVARFALDGSLRFAKSFGGPGDQNLQAMVVDTCGNIVLGGDFKGSVDFGGGELKATEGSLDAFLVKLRGDGTHVWSHRFGDAAKQTIYAVAVSPLTGEVFFGGENSGTIELPGAGAGSLTSNAEVDLFVAKIPP